MCCLAAMSLTLASCDTDNDGYKSLTKEEVKAAFNTVKGDYVGKLIYEAPIAPCMSRVSLSLQSLMA